MAPGHDRPRCVYVDFLNTGPAVSKTLRTVCHRTSGIRKAGDLCVVDLVRARRRSHRRGRAASGDRRAGHHRREGDHPGDRRPDAALPPQQRLRQHGRRRLCAGAARRRDADRHGIRAVLPDRPSRAAPDRHGPDHVGSVPLQARRPAAQRAECEEFTARYGIARGRQLRAHARPRDLRDHQGGRGRPRLAAWRRVSELRALLGRGAARRVRPGDRPARRQRHRSHPACRSKSRRSRIITWAASVADARMATECRACLPPARRSAAPTAPTGSRAMRSPRRWCSAARAGRSAAARAARDARHASR